MKPIHRHINWNHNNRIISLFFLWVIFISLPCFSWAESRQIVTKKERLWAKRMLENEKSLKALYAPNTLAVFYFQNMTEQAELDPFQKGLPFMLITDLSKVRGVQVIERANLQALLEEIKLADSGLIEPNTVSRVGKLLGAQRIVTGRIFKGKSNLIQVKSQFFEVASARILDQPIIEGTPTELFRMEKEILFNIIKSLKIELSHEEEEELNKPLSAKFQTMVSLFKGIEASDQGDYRRAIHYYEMALKGDPSSHFIQEPLGKLKNLDLSQTKDKRILYLEGIKSRTSLTDEISTEDSTEGFKPPSDLINQGHTVESSHNEYP